MANSKVFLVLLSVLIVAAILTSTHAASVYQKREVETICVAGGRCGWFVYNKATRYLEDPHRACECPTGEKCVRTEDDIAVSAYVYRCRSTSQSGDTNSS